MKQKYYTFLLAFMSKLLGVPLLLLLFVSSYPVLVRTDEIIVPREEFAIHRHGGGVVSFNNQSNVSSGGESQQHKRELLIDEDDFVQLKLHWEEGYTWGNDNDSNNNNDNKPKQWCAACLVKDCSSGSIVLNECNVTDLSQRWKLSDDGNKVIPLSSDNTCLTYRNVDRITVRRCNVFLGSEQNVRIIYPPVDATTSSSSSNTTSNKFQLKESGGRGRCVTSRASPRDRARLRMVNCNTALQLDAAFWVSGQFNGHTATESPSTGPSAKASNVPTSSKSLVPTTVVDSVTPSAMPSSNVPTKSLSPTVSDSLAPSAMSSDEPTFVPTPEPTVSSVPTMSSAPSRNSTIWPSSTPTTTTMEESTRPTTSPTTTISLSQNPTTISTISPTTISTTSPTTTTVSFTSLPSLVPTELDTNRGFYNSADRCEETSDGICPCYPQDDDWYCDSQNPWILTGVNNVAADDQYQVCDTARFPTCRRGQKLCPMRKPRLDRYYGDDRKDVYYYIDYDCIRCVPLWENCSKCSPGVWCEGVQRCVGPAYTRWCNINFPGTVG